jgi:hypothetical protein
MFGRFAALAFAALLAEPAATAQPVPAASPSPPSATPAPQPNDYADPGAWLCRPGRQDACTVDLDATVLQADGSMKTERFVANPNPPIDCFYVYPTVSNDPGGNATMTISADETTTAAIQFARLGSRCRLFAPMYRQVTLSALRARMAGHPIPADRGLAYGDVRDAWNAYLAHDNHGRGVVLVGHSQGSAVLTALIAREIDGKPVQKQIISAILMGTSLQVPKGRDVGGDFKSTPLCRAPGQVGCAIAYVSFRADSPPPPGSFFGQGRDGMVAACVNPAALAGGSAMLKPYFVSPSGPEFVRFPTPAWTNPPTPPIPTPFVTTPGLVSAECVSDAHGVYLAITVHPTPGGKRVNDIPGDLIVGGVTLKNWGLHLVDANLAMGDLLDVVDAQSKAYLAKAR